ncbi:MAG TPA: YtxH domain-containing protein [Candidatus Eisenbacteria bacterium]
MTDFLRNNGSDELERRRRLSMKAVVAGSIVGAGAALLLAPCSGRDLRCKIREGSGKIGRSVGDRASHLAHDAARLGRKVGRAVSTAAADVKDSLRAGRNAMNDVADGTTSYYP